MLHCTYRYDAVQFGLCYFLLHILCLSWAKLNLAIVDVYAGSHVALSEILHAPIHDKLNNFHKRESTTTMHNHIKTLCMVCCLNTIPHSVGIIKEWPFFLGAPRIQCENGFSIESLASAAWLMLVPAALAFTFSAVNWSSICHKALNFLYWFWVHNLLNMFLRSLFLKWS